MGPKDEPCDTFDGMLVDYKRKLHCSVDLLMINNIF
jgi:hypothetical protein